MHLMRDEAWAGETEFFQFSKGVHIKYNRTTHELEEFTFRGKPVEDEETYSIAIQHYHYSNIETSLGITLEEASMIRKPKVVASSVNNIVEEYFATHQDLDSHVEGRIEIVD
jgi:5'-nucleotidase